MFVLLLTCFLFCSSWLGMPPTSVLRFLRVVGMLDRCRIADAQNDHMSRFPVATVLHTQIDSIQMIRLIRRIFDESQLNFYSMEGNYNWI